jgi:hypothetical protein
MTVNGPVPGHTPAPGADVGPGAPAGGRAAQRLIAVLLLAAAALDLARCGLAMAARHPAPATGLISAGLAAAAASGWAARGHLRGRRWPAWAAVLIGVASAPQAAASGFHGPYTFPDAATAVLGIVLAVAVLATADRSTPGRHAENPCAMNREIAG